MNRRGYTLVELMTVVVVAAILFIAALPDQGAADAQHARDVAMRLESDIAAAQNMSIAEPTDPIVLRVDPVANKYWLARQSAPDAPITDSRTGRDYTVGLADSSASTDVDIVGVDFNGDDSLGFDGTGMIDQDVPALIQIQCGAATFEVACTPTTGSIVTEAVFSKDIPHDSVATASGVTRVVGTDSNINERETGVVADRSAASVPKNSGLLSGVGSLLTNLLGG